MNIVSSKGLLLLVALVATACAFSIQPNAAMLS